MKDNFSYSIWAAILPQTPVENVFKLVETVRNFKNRFKNN